MLIWQIQKEIIIISDNEQNGGGFNNIDLSDTNEEDSDEDFDLNDNNSNQMSGVNEYDDENNLKTMLKKEMMKMKE